MADTGRMLHQRLAYLEAAVAEARRAMLSRKKAMLAAHLIDAFADRMFAARAQLIRYRTGLNGALLKGGLPIAPLVLANRCTIVNQYL
jgi:hypothetical protein